MAYKKLTKLQMSNNAHGLLKRKHMNSKGSRSGALYDYHNQCQIIQSVKRRVLSKSERRALYNKLVD